MSGDRPEAREVGTLIANGWLAVRSRGAEEDAKARLGELGTLLQTGGRVAFGPFTVGLAGLEHAGRVLAWKKISEVDLMGSTIHVLVIGERKPAARQPVSSVPDSVLFLDRLGRPAAVGAAAHVVSGHPARTGTRQSRLGPVRQDRQLPRTCHRRWLSTSSATGYGRSCGSNAAAPSSSPART